MSLFSDDIVFYAENQKKLTKKNTPPPRTNYVIIAEL